LIGLQDLPKVFSLMPYFEKYGPRLLVLVVIPIIISISSFPYLLFYDVSDIRNLIIFGVIFVISLVVKILMTGNYTNSVATALLSLLCIFLSIKSKNYLSDLKNTVETYTNQKISDEKAFLDDAVQNFNNRFRPPNSLHFGLTYALVNSVVYSSYLQLLLRIFIVFSKQWISQDISGIALTLFMITTFVPFIFIGLCIIFTDYIVVKTVDEQLSMTEVVLNNRKSPIVGVITKETANSLTILSLNCMSDSKFPDNIKTHAVEIEIPRKNVKFVIRHYVQQTSP